MRLQNQNLPSKRNGYLKPLETWNLFDLLTVAKERNWLPVGSSFEDEWDDASAQIGDYGDVIRQIRNLVHPIRYALDLPRKRITKRYLDISRRTHRQPDCSYVAAARMAACARREYQNGQSRRGFANWAQRLALMAYPLTTCDIIGQPKRRAMVHRSTASRIQGGGLLLLCHSVM